MTEAAVRQVPAGAGITAGERDSATGAPIGPRREEAPPTFVMPGSVATSLRMQTQLASQASVIEVNELSFQHEVLEHQGLVLVDFSTEWCAPCRALTPLVREIARERAGTLKVVAVDGDAAPNLTARYGVRGFPTVILFRSGEEVARRLGLTTKKKLLEMVAST